MIFIAQSKEGKLKFSSIYAKNRFTQDLKDNDGARYRITRETPESRKQRGFYHGAVIPLWIYLDGNDYRNSTLIEHYHHEAKKEFNTGMIVRNGVTEKYGKSTKGILNKGYLDKVVDHLEEQYGIKRQDVLDNEHYKEWRDSIYPHGGPDHYIAYLIELKKV